MKPVVKLSKGKNNMKGGGTLDNLHHTLNVINNLSNNQKKKCKIAVGSNFVLDAEKARIYYEDYKNNTLSLTSVFAPSQGTVYKGKEIQLLNGVGRGVPYYYYEERAKKLGLADMVEESGEFTKEVLNPGDVLIKNENGTYSKK